jgi:KipI family sensor histidine kinase inhibitor
VEPVGAEPPVGSAVPVGPVGPVVPVGERSVLVRCASLDEVHALRRRVLVARLPGVVDVVPGWASLLVVAAAADERLAPRVAELAAAAGVDDEAFHRPGPLVELPVTYDGADLAEVAHELGCSVPEVVDRHAAPTYTVAFLGFLAGFPYLAGLDPALHVPRLAVPRTLVPAGSVAVAGAQAGVYPSAAPGGWRLLGRTDEVLFDPRADPPARLLPGDRVRFVPRERRPAGTPRSTQRGRAPTPREQPPAGAVLQVLEASPGCVVVDHGRVGLAHLGVPRGGAFDRGAFELANRLVGNPAGAAALEVPLGGLTLRVTAPVTVAVTGTDAPVTAGPAGGSPVPAGGSKGPAGGSARPAPVRQARSLAAGEVLHVGRPAVGVRAYVGVRGGVGTEMVLGSRSGTPVTAGDRLPVGGLSPVGPPWLDAVPPARPPAGPVVELAVAPGPDDDRLPPAALAALCRTPWTVHPASDRTGIRLQGPPLPPGLAPGSRGEAVMPSAGVLPGFVQVVPGGHPLLLGPDCGTTGGYPVLAVLLESSLDRAAQLRPGERVDLRLRAG